MDAKHFVIRALIAEGVLTEVGVQLAAKQAQASGKTLSEALSLMGGITSRQLALCQAKVCEFPFVELSQFDVDIRNARLLPRTAAERWLVFPLFALPGITTVGMADPLNLQAIDQIRQLLKTEVDPVLVEPDVLRSLIARAYSLSRTDAMEPDKEARPEAESGATGEEPIVAAVTQILSTAAELGASDVHLNPDEDNLHLRYRVDGVLHPQQGPSKSAHMAIIQRLKVMAKLDLTQTRKPQDGKFRFTHRNEPVDVRLSLVPTIHGENAVMRLLRSASKITALSDMGMSATMTGWFQEAIERPHGIILVTGPTGSGKTTTLYTAINHLNKPDVNIMAIEDPVEVRLPMIRQIQANAEVGLTFASALRSVLRQDPDIILVGEVRDEETAKIAVQAALTGHLVLSTLHTNDAVGSIARLRDFQVPTFAINGALLCTIAQRLVRCVCPKCSVADESPLSITLPEHMRRMTFRRAVGCQACRSLGYRGRLGVFEMLRMTPGVQRAIEGGAPGSDIERIARDEGMRLLWEDGVDKAGAGLTTLEEVMPLRAVTLEDRGAEPASRSAA